MVVATQLHHLDQGPPARAQPHCTATLSGLAGGETSNFIQSVNKSTGMYAGTASHQGTVEKSAHPRQTWENLRTTQGISFHEMASTEASRNEQTKTVTRDPDSLLDLDLITESKPFDQFSLHPP